MGDPFVIETPIFKGAVQLFQSSETSAFHDEHTGDGFRVTVMDVAVAPFGTLVALRLENQSGDKPWRPALMKKTNPQESRIFIVDREHDQFIYPKSTDLGGEVPPGVSRLGVVVFEPFRQPTGTIEIHFSGIKLVGARGQGATFQFALSSPQLKDSIESVLREPPFRVQVEQEMRRLQEEQTTAIRHTQANALARRGGCRLFALLLAGAVGLLFAASAFGVYLLV